MLLSCGQERAVSEDAVRAKIIVNGIESYIAQEGAPPANLNALVKENKVPSIKAVELDDPTKYSYQADSDQFQLQVADNVVPTRSVVLYRSSKKYDDCVPGAKLNAGYKVVDAKLQDGLMVLREQTD